MCVGRNASGLPFYDVAIVQVPFSHSLPVATMQETKRRVEDGRWTDVDFIYFTESDQVNVRVNKLLYLYTVPLQPLPRHSWLPSCTLRRCCCFENKTSYTNISWSTLVGCSSLTDSFLIQLRSGLPGHVHCTRWDEIICAVLPARFLTPCLLTSMQVISRTLGRSLSAVGPWQWQRMSCCMPRQNCKNRDSWVSARDVTLRFLNMFGLQVALGNCNFHLETFRTCKLYPDGILPFCPWIPCPLNAI